jgi:hypothetical protein
MKERPVALKYAEHEGPNRLGDDDHEREIDQDLGDTN